VRNSGGTETSQVAPPSAEGPPPAGEASNGSPSPRPPRSRSYAGRARAFRDAQAEIRRARRELLGNVIVVLIIALGVYAIVTAKPLSSSGAYVPPKQGPPIRVYLGTPSVSNVPCGGGGSAFAERIPWINSSEPIQTGDINLRVYEIWDGDWIGDSGVVANVTSTDVCAGSAPGSVNAGLVIDWYAVLTAPNGTNLLTYTDAHPWTPVSGSASSIWIEDGSALVVVTDPAIAQTGRGFAVFGFENGSAISGTTPL